MLILMITRALFFVLLIMSFIFPPYFAIDTKSYNTIHTSMGYYPVWNRPGGREAFDVLVREGKVNQRIGASQVIEYPPDIDQFEARLNTVRFIINILMISILALIIQWLVKYLDKRVLKRESILG